MFQQSDLLALNKVSFRHLDLDLHEKVSVGNFVLEEGHSLAADHFCLAVAYNLAW